VSEIPQEDRGPEPASVLGVFAWITHHPWESVGRRWNYKAAVMSAIVRSSLFCATNAGAGLDAAVAAMATEFWFRFATAGFYGALTQAFRRVEPAAVATLAAIVVLPTVAHTLEFLVHFLRGTVALAASIGVSIAVTVLSTSFTLFAMRRGAFVVGHGRSLLSDLVALPRLLVLFVSTAARHCARSWA
jgi:hypothetical protein